MGLRDASQRPADGGSPRSAYKGVRLVFASGPRSACDREPVGRPDRTKARTLRQVVTWLQETMEVHADEQDLLDVELLDEWNTQTEDGSVGQVAQCVARSSTRRCGGGDQVEAPERTEETRRLGENLDCAPGEAAGGEGGDCSRGGGEGEKEGEEAPRVDDDGETVPSRRR